MKTTISIRVKEEFITTKAFSSLFWFVKIFQKSKVLVSVNGEAPMTLVASKEFHEIEVQPGTVTLQFTDPCAKGKDSMRRFTGIFTGFAFGLAGGGRTALDLAATGSELSKLDLQDDILECTLEEGDNLKLSCVSTRKGQVKVKVLKD